MQPWGDLSAKGNKLASEGIHPWLLGWPITGSHVVGPIGLPIFGHWIGLTNCWTPHASEGPACLHFCFRWGPELHASNREGLKLLLHNFYFFLFLYFQLSANPDPSFLMNENLMAYILSRSPTFQRSLDHFDFFFNKPSPKINLKITKFSSKNSINSMAKSSWRLCWKLGGWSSKNLKC